MAVGHFQAAECRDKVAQCGRALDHESEACVPVLALPLTHWATSGKFLLPVLWFLSLSPEASHGVDICDFHKCLGEAARGAETWAGLGRVGRGDTSGMKTEEAWGLVHEGSGRGKVGPQIPCRGAGLNAVSYKVPVRILGHGVGITKAPLSLVRMF